jgi:hypothetical protein
MHQVNVETQMRADSFVHDALIVSLAVFVTSFPLLAQQRRAAVPVRMTVTVRLLDKDKRMPDVSREDVIVRQDNHRLKVTGWRSARGGQAGLDLFILIDDTSDPSLGSQLDDLRAFINAQPQTTSVGVGYMRNATVQIVQNFTAEHSQAAKALRLPVASSGAYGSPYLSVIDLMKRWPGHSNRREVIMVTDGIDRARGGPRYRGLSFITPDVDSASRVAQRTGTIIHTIFTRGVGRLGSNFWEITNGQNGIAKLSDETGGWSFYLGTQNSVSFQPYLDDLQSILDNQFLLDFQALPGKKAGLQHVRLTTEVAGVELDSADSVWVPSSAQ